MPQICERGFSLLNRLAAAGSFSHVVEALALLSPLFFPCPAEASKSEGFVSSLAALADAERSVLQKAKELVVVDFPGEVIEDLANLVQKQILTYSR